ncbi:DUF922 domain-containing protein [Aquimarina sp. Aq78]|uniref:DUF922 domain-containing protein n=1 Tax=Aquimarina sp. Aq78 TaxID=1191889 RepID=UPI000D111324|nr:DUF922 domain-containing protein [Aquimarina sp. Aq78]
MKYLIHSIFILVLLIISSNLIAQEESNKNIVEWKSDRKLLWSDFIAEPNTDIFAFALTSYKIEIFPTDVMVDENNNIQNYKDLHLNALFYKNHSWVIKKTEKLLQHEQLHFDIAELFARKMRQKFEELKVQNIADYDSYMSVYTMLWKKCRKMQNDYDEKTNHGIKEAINSQWQINVHSELQDLNSFALE